MEKRSSFKELSKKICTANKMVYVESVRKLLKDYNTHDSPVSLTTFFNCKRFYSTLPSEKEKVVFVSTAKPAITIANN